MLGMVYWLFLESPFFSPTAQIYIRPRSDCGYSCASYDRVLQPGSRAFDILEPPGFLPPVLQRCGVNVDVHFQYI